MVGLSDANIFGTGNTPEIQDHFFSRRDFSYGGNIVEYKNPQRAGDILHTADFGRPRLL